MPSKSKAAPAKKAPVRKPTTRKPSGPQRTYTLNDAAVAEHLHTYLHERGTSIDALIAMALRMFDVKPDMLDLRSKMSFGKYYGEVVEDVIRNDLSYFLWVLAMVERVRFTQSCVDLAERLQEESNGH